MLPLLFLILMDSCQPDQVLDDGLICCNYTICDQYCYEDQCMSPKEVWFCTEGYTFVLFMKFAPSIIFTIIGFILRCLSIYPPNLLISFDWFSDHFLFLFLKLLSESILNFFLFSLIVSFRCLDIPGFIVFCICVLSIIIPYYDFVFEYGTPFCKHQKIIFTRFSDNSSSPAIYFNNLNNRLLNIWIVIFTLTGYYGVFDVFAFMLNKNYSYELDNVFHG